jgi:hypothetical protein
MSFKKNVECDVLENELTEAFDAAAEQQCSAFDAAAEQQCLELFHISRGNSASCERVLGRRSPAPVWPIESTTKAHLSYSPLFLHQPQAA